jgi:hypothetical protein
MAGSKGFPRKVKGFSEKHESNEKTAKRSLLFPAHLLEYETMLTHNSRARVILGKLWFDLGLKRGTG